jgi:hypothetical protein
VFEFEQNYFELFSPELKPGTFFTLAENSLTLSTFLWGIMSLGKHNPGANPTIASYNASAVKIYNASGSLARFENRNIFFYFEKMLQPTTRLA